METLDNPETLQNLLKLRLTEALDRRLKLRQSEPQSKSELNEDCEDLKIIGLAKSFGSKEVEYEGGVVIADFESRAALEDFTNALEDLEYVDSYEIRVEGDEADVTPYETLPADIKAIVIVYIAEDYIDYGYYEDEVDEVDEVGTNAAELTEVKRRIKVNFRGKKRVKMQCKPGFKWNAGKRVCEKIAGDELAKNRKSHRRAILTKRSMGSAFKKRVLRKTTKARRFRKALGLK